MLIALSIGGCAARQRAPSDQVAMLERDPNTFVQYMDGSPLAHAGQPVPVAIPVGRHTIQVRRRIEMPARSRLSSYGSQPDAHDPLATASYLTESSCPLTFDARAGARYVVRTDEPADGTVWTATIVGPDVDGSCTARDWVRHDLVGQTRFLCCTMRFSDEVATDANYRYEGADTSTLPAGTRIVVTDAGRNQVSFRPENSNGTHKLYLEYGVGQLDAQSYFDAVLRDADPMQSADAAPPRIAEAIRAGDLLPGMTRAQTILARGYPPAHHTPNLEAAEWIYYDSPGRSVYVLFVDGVIKSLNAGDAP